MNRVKHVGIVMDGNRRYAKKKGLKSWQGHEHGAKVVEKLMKWCRDLEIKELTLYTFSLENFKRPKKEKTYLFNLIFRIFKKYLKDNKSIIDKYKIKIRFIGLIEKFPKKVQDIMFKIMKKTKDYSNYVVNFAMGYTGRNEIVEATKKIAMEVKLGKINPEKINEKTIMKNLFLPSEPDLIIRTGGQVRLSGFLAFQSTYTELYFLKKLWPEFTKSDLKKAINDFETRKRNFGK